MGIDLTKNSGLSSNTTYYFLINGVRYSLDMTNNTTYNDVISAFNNSMNVLGFEATAVGTTGNQNILIVDNNYQDTKCNISSSFSDYDLLRRIKDKVFVYTPTYTTIDGSNLTNSITTTINGPIVYVTSTNYDPHIYMYSEYSGGVTITNIVLSGAATIAHELNYNVVPYTLSIVGATLYFDPMRATWYLLGDNTDTTYWSSLGVDGIHPLYGIILDGDNQIISSLNQVAVSQKKITTSIVASNTNNQINVIQRSNGIIISGSVIIQIATTTITKKQVISIGGSVA